MPAATKLLWYETRRPATRLRCTTVELNLHRVHLGQEALTITIQAVYNALKRLGDSA